jgi:hypothetical protein
MKNSKNKIHSESIISIIDDVIGRERLEKPDSSGIMRIMAALEEEVHVARTNLWNKAFRITVATIGLAASIAIGIGLGGIYSHTPDYYEYSVMVHDAQIENLDLLIGE